MQLLNDSTSSPLRYVAADGRVFGQFYNSWDQLYHLAEYVPWRKLPTRYMCGGRDNFSPSREERLERRCPECFARLAELALAEGTPLSPKGVFVLDISAPTPAPGKHGFIGVEGHIEESQSSWAARTGFSLGVFEWVPTANGQGLKKGPVKVRIKGFFSKADQVYKRAREVCAQLDAGEAVTQKSISI